jgi:hypothetical protein
MIYYWKCHIYSIPHLIDQLASIDLKEVTIVVNEVSAEDSKARYPRNVQSKNERWRVLSQCHDCSKGHRDRGNRSQV